MKYYHLHFRWTHWGCDLPLDKIASSSASASSLTECLGTSHGTKHLPGAGDHFSTHFQKLPGLLLHLTETWDSAHRQRSTALPAPVMLFGEAGSLQGFSWKPGAQSCNCALACICTSSFQSQGGRIAACRRYMQKRRRKNTLELAFKPLFKMLLLTFPHGN